MRSWVLPGVVLLVLGLPATALAIPDTSLTAAPPAATNSPSATFAFTGTSANKFQCSLDGVAFADCTSPKSYTGLTEAPHQFRVRAVQTTGGAGPIPDPTPAQHNWTVDFTPPETALDSGPPALTNVKDTTFAFSSEPGATFECSLNGSAYAACTSPQAYNGLSDGTRNFRIRAVDAATNTDTSPVDVTWTVDTTPPDTTITTGPSGASNVLSPQVEFGATEPGSTFACSLNLAAFAPCTSPDTLGGLADGALSYRVQAVDAAGNADPTPARRDWTRDTVPPGKPTVLVVPAPAGARQPTPTRPVAQPRGGPGRPGPAPLPPPPRRAPGSRPPPDRSPSPAAARCVRSRRASSSRRGRCGSRGPRDRARRPRRSPSPRRSASPAWWGCRLPPRSPRTRRPPTRTR